MEVDLLKGRGWDAQPNDANYWTAGRPALSLSRKDAES